MSGAPEPIRVELVMSNPPLTKEEWAERRRERRARRERQLKDAREYRRAFSPEPVARKPWWLR